jgi:hypothetical protein
MRHTDTGDDELSNHQENRSNRLPSGTQRGDGMRPRQRYPVISFVPALCGIIQPAKPLATRRSLGLALDCARSYLV